MLAGCSGGAGGGDGGWPDDKRNEFVTSCTDAAGGQEAYCECTADALEAEYTVEEIEKMTSPDDIKEMSDIISSCIDKME